MSHRINPARTPRRTRRSAAASGPARAVLAAALLAVPAVGGATPVAPPATTTAADWDQRITTALAETGTVDRVLAELARAPAGEPGVLAARAHAAEEAGDLAAAVAALQQLRASSPAADVATLGELAAVQEMLGQTAAAEQTLRATVAASSDPAVVGRLTLRLAAMLFDDDRPADGTATLDGLVRSDRSAAVPAGVVAYLAGQWSAAARYLAAADGSAQGVPVVAVRLLQGTAAVKAGQTDAASAAFTAAADDATRPADRRYAEDRLVATARQAGTLPQLADRWLAQSDLPADRMLPLATVLRELGRVPDLLRWWRAAAADPARAAAVRADPFVREVLGAAQSAGRSDDVVAICRDMLARDPDDRQWLSATVRALLDQGKASDADALLRSRLDAAADRPADLLAMGKLARSFGRDAVALDAAGRLAPFGGDTAIDGLLLAASVYGAAGDAPRAAGVLQQAAVAAGQHPAAAGPVVDALEAAGLQPDAVRLLADTTARDPKDEAALGHLASLLIDLHRPADAVPVLERLTRSADATAATRSQAARQLLAASAEAGTLPDLIARTRDRLDRGTGDEQDLSLLVDALLRTKNPTAAVDAIRTSRLLDEAERLRRLAVLFLRAKDPARAEPVLQRLVAADPADAVLTLERLASVAVGRGDTAGATAAIGQIERRVGTGPSSLGLMAGVLDRLGRPADAARLYRRAVAADPSDGDAWLLWATAMAKAGGAARAEQRLQVLCGRADTDSLFGVAVDGLLNLTAPPAVLRAARVDAVVRAAVRPDRTVLYHILADLSDELHDPGAEVRAAEVTVAVSDEERPERLRELMDVAGQGGQVDTAVDCGRSLLASGDEFPPQLFLELGEQLLIAGRPADATRAFSRASEASDPDAVARRAAALLDRYGYPAEAAAVLGAVAVHQPNDADLDGTLGRLDEVIGQDGPAFGFYVAAATAAARDLPTDPAAGDERGDRRPPDAQVTAFDRMVAGATATARTADQRAALVDRLRSRLAERIAAAADSPGPTVDVVTIAAALRQVGFATDRPDVSAGADAAVIARWPDAVGYASRAVDRRLDAELDAAADRFAAAHHVEPNAALRLVRHLTGPGPTTRPAAYTLEQAAEALPPLIVRGETDAARQVLAGVPPGRPATWAGSGPRAAGLTATPVQAVVAAAATVGEPELATAWSLRWLDAVDVSGMTPPLLRPPAPGRRAPIRRPAPSLNYLVPQRYTPVISGSWRFLSPDGRARLVNRLVAQADKAKDRGLRATLSFDALQLAVTLPPTRPDTTRPDTTRPDTTRPDTTRPDTTRPDTTRLALDSIDDAATSEYYPIWTLAAQVVHLVPAADRPGVIRQACGRVPANARLSFLFAVVAQASEPFDAATASAVAGAAEQVRGGQAIDWDQWFYSGWFANAAQRAVLPALAEAAARSAADPGRPAGTGPAVLTVAAAALSVAGDAGRADELAARAAAAVRVAAPAVPTGNLMGPQLASVGGTPLPGRFVLLRTAVAALSPQARTRLVAADGGGHGPTAAPDGDPAGPAVRAILLDGVGRRSAALDVLRAGFAATPTNVDLLQVYAERLLEDRRTAELVGPVATRLGSTDNGRSPIRYAVANGLGDLFRGREVHDNYSGTSVTPDLATPAARGDAAGMAVALREMLQAIATPYGAPRSANTPNPGGLAPWSAAALDDPPAALNGFAHWPGALDAVMQALQTPAEGRSELYDASYDLTANWLATLAARAAAGDGAVRQLMVQRLQGAVDTLTRGDRLLAMRLAVMPGVELPPSLVGALMPAALNDASGTEERELADALAAQHAPAADGVNRWADALVNSAPYARRPGTPPVEPTPVDPVDDDHVVAWLSAAFPTDPSAAERRLAVLRDVGQVTPRFTRCAVLWARYAAERGDLPAYAARLDVAVGAEAWQRVIPRSSYAAGVAATAAAPPDLCEALPATVVDPARRAAVVDAVTRSLSGVAKRWPADTDVVRQLAAVGQWAARQGDRATARAVLDHAVQVADRQGPGEHQLWVADLAREVGEDPLADRLELGLLDERCLPAVRIAPLLRRLQSQGRSDDAVRLARAAAAYCREPNVLALAGGTDVRP